MKRIIAFTVFLLLLPIVLVGQVAPVVTITPLSTPKVSPSEQLTLVGAVLTTLPVSLNWTVSPPVIDLDDSTVVYGSRHSPALVIRPNVLTPGSVYTFRLTATDTLAQEGFAEIVVKVNTPPMSGTFEVSPTGGTITTPFTLSCEGWTDDPEDLPLSYSFYARVDSGPELILSSLSTLNTITTVLPPGSITLIARISDQLGATAKETFHVSVNVGVSLPVITGFAPLAGPVGSFVTITGVHLDGATQVSFNGMPSPSVNGDSTHIVCQVPPGATTGPITVLTPSGTASSDSPFVVITVGMISVVPDSIDFVSIPIGDVAVESLYIQNIGSTPVLIDPLLLLGGGTEGFKILPVGVSNLLAPGEILSVGVAFSPFTPGDVYGAVGVSVGGNLVESVLLKGRGIETMPPTVNVEAPAAGDTLSAGQQVMIRFSATDNFGLRKFLVSVSSDGGVNFPGNIAHIVEADPSPTIVREILWNVPDGLATTQGVIRVQARDVSGNSTVGYSGQFVVIRPVNDAPMLQVTISFDPPPPGNVAPPQNVRATARELTSSGGPPPSAGWQSLLSGTNITGYNIYRVPMPPEGDPLPTAEEIVGDSTNLVGSISADSVSYDDLLSQLRGDRFVYSLVTLYDDGGKSGGSTPALTTYNQAETGTANGWFGPLDNTNSPWYTFPSVDAATLSITTIVPPGSPQINRSMKIAVRNRGTNYASFQKQSTSIPRPFDLQGIEARVRRIGGRLNTTLYVDFVYNGQLYSSNDNPVLADESWQTVVFGTNGIPDVSIVDTIILGIGNYMDSCHLYVDYLAFLGAGGYTFDYMGDTEEPPSFLTVPPETLLSVDPVKGTFLKPVKRGKGLFPNWANLFEETVAQGAFQPGSSQSDSAGGLRIGQSFMFRSKPLDPLNPRWRPVKDSADHYAWVRLTKWDFKKNKGKSAKSIQKTLASGIFRHDGPPRGLDSTGSPGNSGRKRLHRQLSKLDPKKTSNSFFRELVALKFNIAASALGKIPNGLGELLYDSDGNVCDDLAIAQIASKADSMATFWQLYPVDDFDSVFSAMYQINRAFSGQLDTVTFEHTGSIVLKGQVQLTNVPYLTFPPGPFVPTRIIPTSSDTETEDEFDDESFDGGIPRVTTLHQNYPNPFNPVTTIEYEIPVDGLVTMTVFDILGREVGTLVNEWQESGVYEASFDGTHLASGIYFYRLQTVSDDQEDPGTFSSVRKLVLLK